MIDGIGNGPDWCCHSSRPAADLWSLVWERLFDVGRDSVLFQKVKAHATQADVDAGRSSAWLKSGNDNADHFAGRGSALAEHLSSTERDRQHFLEAKRWYGWLGELVDHWPNDTQARSAQRVKRSVGNGSVSGGPRAHSPLDLVAAPAGPARLVGPAEPVW